MAPWLTVVTVVRNDAPGLSATIASVAGQRQDGVEHLIVDGASTDDTTLRAGQAAARDAAMRVISEPDDGIYDAMNKGWRRANGGYVHFLNAGDVYRGDHVLASLRPILRDPVTLPWLRTRVRFVDEHGAPTRPLAAAGITGAFWWGWQPVAHQGAFMARDLLASLGGFDPRWQIVADYDLMRRAWASGVRPVVSTEITVAVDASGISTQRFAQGFTEMHAARSIGRSGPVRVASRVDAAAHTAVVSTRRRLRRHAERALGSDRVSRLRAGSAQ